MFNKLKDNVSKSRDSSKFVGDRNQSARSRTSSTRSDAPHGGTPSPALIDWTNDSTHGDSDSASVLSSTCPSTAEAEDQQVRLQKMLRVARCYKAKFKEATDMYNKLKQERDQLQELLSNHQTQSFRRMDELREELALDKKAKQDVEDNYNLMLSEKEELIQVLRLQVSLLKEGKDLPPELDTKIKVGQRLQTERQRILDQEKQNLTFELENLTTQLRLTTAQLEEQTVQRSQLEESVKDYQAKLEKLQLQSEECGRLKHELTDSKLAQSALEEQVQGLKQQLSALYAPSTAQSRETEVHFQRDESDENVQRLQFELAERTKELEKIRKQLDKDGLAHTHMVEELASHKDQDLDSQQLHEQYELTCAKLTEVERALEEKVNELATIGIAQQNLIAREQDLVGELEETKANLMKMKTQLGASAQRVSELENQCIRFKSIQDSQASLEYQFTVLIESNKRLRSHLLSKLQNIGIQPITSGDDHSLEGLTDQLLEFLYTATHRLVEAESELKLNGDQNVEKLSNLKEKYAAEVHSLQETVKEERKQKEELDHLLRQSKAHLQECEAAMLKLSSLESSLTMKDDEIHRLQMKLEEMSEQEAVGCSALNRLLESVVNERDELRTKVVILEDKFTEQHQRSDMLKHGHIIDMEREIASLQAKLSAETSEKEKCIAQLQQEMVSWESKSRESCEVTAHQCERLTSLELLVASSVKRLADVEHYMEALSSQQVVKTSLLEQLDEAKSNLGELHSEKLQLIGEVDRANEQMTVLKAKCEETYRQLYENTEAHMTAFLKFRIHRLKHISSLLLADGDNASSVLAASISSVETQVEDLIHQLSSTESTIPHDELVKSSESIEHQLDELQSIADRCLLGLNEQKGLIKIELEHKNQQLASTDKELCQTRDLLKSTEESNSVLTANIRTLEQELTSERERMEHVKNQLVNAEQSLKVMEKTNADGLDSLQQQLTATVHDLETVRSALLEKECGISKLEDANRNLTEQLSTLRQTYSDIIKQATVSQSESLHLRSEQTREWIARNGGDHGTLDVQSINTHLQSIGQLLSSSSTLDFTDPNKLSAYLVQLSQAEQWLADISCKAETNRLEELTKLKALQGSEQRLASQCESLEQRVKELEEELEQRQTELISLRESEEQLVHIRTIVEELQKSLAEKTELIRSTEVQLTELRATQETLNGTLMAKQIEIDSLTIELSKGKAKLADLQQEFEQSCSDREHLEERLKLVSQQAEEEKRALHQSFETSASVKQGQLKQQLKEVKARLCQVLHDSETVRKSNVSLVARENELTSKLQEVESELILQKQECEQLRLQIEELTKQLDKSSGDAQIVPVALVQSEAPPDLTPLNQSLDYLREHMQHENELLKAEHAAYVQEMQREFNEQLKAREEELHVEFRNQLDRAHSVELQLRESCQSEMNALHSRLSELDTENCSLQNQLDELRAQLATMEQPHQADPCLSKEDRRELEELRERVKELENKLKDSFRVDQERQKPDSPSPTSTTNEVHVSSVHPGQRYLSSTESDSLDPLQLAKPSNWVEQLRSEIIHADSIDALHPALRAGHFVNTVSAQDYEALQLHNADLQNQLQQLAAEFELLRVRCSSCHGAYGEKVSRSNSIPPYSPSLNSTTGSLHEMVEYEYLKNVLFEYMTGRETATLAKVLCSILKFNADQTKRVLQYEDMKSKSWFIQTTVE